MRPFLLLPLVALALAGCGPGAPRLYKGAVNRDVMIVVEPSGRGELVSHAIFAQPQRDRLGDYARLDARKEVDCEAGKLLLKEASGYSPSGARISTISVPGAWTKANGAEAIELRIACDREFAASRRLGGSLDELAAFYRTQVEKTS